MFCKNCGSKIEDGVKFCMQCGTAVNVVTAQTPPITETPRAVPAQQSYTGTPVTKSTGKKKPLIIAVIAVIGLGALLIGFVVNNNNSRQNTPYNRYSDIADNTTPVQPAPNNAETVNPASSQVNTHNERAWAFFNQGNFDSAIAEYSEAIRLDPNSANAYFGRGNAYGMKGDQDRAMADFTEVIRIDPNNAFAYDNRGFLRGQKGDMDRAIADFTEAIRLNPNYANAYKNRGMAYGMKGDMDRAIADFTEAIRLDPNNAEAYYGRAMIYGQRGNYTQARADVNRVLQIDPNHQLGWNLDGQLRQLGY